LQQILHEVTICGPQRPSLQEELDNGWQDDKPPQMRAQEEGASIWDEQEAKDIAARGLLVTVLRATAAGNWLSQRRSSKVLLPWIPQYGILRAILPKSIAEPFELRGDDGTTAAANAASGVTRSAGSLADYWRANGFSYSKEEEQKVCQVVVEVTFSSSSGQQGAKNLSSIGQQKTLTLTYPADKVSIIASTPITTPAIID